MEEVTVRKRLARPMAENGRFESSPSRRLERAIVRTLAYADVFDYPMTVPELHRYLIGVQTTRPQLETALRQGGDRPRGWRVRGSYLTLPGRESVVHTRLRRTRASARLWRKARRYGQRIASLPFVRMVAVTGALAMDNADPGEDIDYLVLTRQGRVWLCRAFTIALVRWAAQRGDALCPNYFLSEGSLVVQPRSLYTAHELMQMVPLSGWDVYARMRRLNGWALDLLPNASGPPARTPRRELPRRGGTASRLAERILRSSAGAWLERRERERKIRKFRRMRQESAEVSLGTDWCKGHQNAHGGRTLAAYTSRLAQLESVFPDLRYQE